MSFPKTGFWWLAWLALVPLFFVLDECRPRAAFGWAYWCGLLFFTGTLYWIGHVTVLGVSLMIAYLAVYFGFLGWCYARLRSHGPIARAVFVPCAWVLGELARAWLLSGFSWASLGLSQYQMLPMIQIADITGFYGVSFLVVFVNFFIKEVIGSSFLRRTPLPGALYVLSFVLLLGNLGYGFVSMVRGRDTGKIIVAAVQGNIDLETRWNESAWFYIIDKYLELSRQALPADMIVWPETAFPGFLWEDEAFLAEIRGHVNAAGTPLLLGAVLNESEHYYNAAVLLGPQNGVLGVYRKKHLVPYGEYIPFRSWMPFLEEIVPIDDFTAGQEYTLLPVPGRNGQTFAALICFEDTVPQLVRKFAAAGAGLFVNMTNDAWFKDSKGLEMHLQSSVFRSIENRRSLVRAANTGVSAFIDPYGRIKSVVQGEGGKMINTEGLGAETLGLRGDISFYTKFGDIFALLCGALAAWGLLPARGKLSSKA